jgi:hypothetical protein
MTVRHMMTMMREGSFGKAYLIERMPDKLMCVMIVMDKDSAEEMTSIILEVQTAENESIV